MQKPTRKEHAGSPSWLYVGLAAMLLAVQGCGSEDSGSSPMAPETTLGEHVSVSYAGQSAEVELAALETTTINAFTAVPLDKVWAATGFGVDLLSLRLDFEGDEGFRPSQKDKCADLLTGTPLLSGGITPDTRDLVWDDALNLPGCYAVRGVRSIDATDLPAR